MVIVNILSTMASPRTVEFGAGVERSAKGSIHFKPGSIKMLTKDEWTCIQKEHKELANHMIVVMESRDSAMPSEPEAHNPIEPELEPEPEPELEPEPEPELEPESRPEESKNDKKVTGGIKKRKVRPPN